MQSSTVCTAASCTSCLFLGFFALSLVFFSSGQLDSYGQELKEGDSDSYTVLYKHCSLIMDVNTLKLKPKFKLIVIVSFLSRSAGEAKTVKTRHCPDTFCSGSVTCSDLPACLLLLARIACSYGRSVNTVMFSSGISDIKYQSRKTTLSFSTPTSYCCSCFK